ncbi:MAG TPA: outer membrane beta-barrel protein [Polyangia bacterium]|jgi:hypothetical protein
MRNTVRGALVMAVVGVVLVVVPASAVSQTRLNPAIDRPGVSLGFAGMGNFVVNQANAPVNGFIDQGGGFGIFVGFRVAPMLALELGYALNIHNPVQDPSGVTIDALLLHAGTFDLKLIIPTPSNVRPFLQVGIGVYELASYADSTNYVTGVGFQLGGGLDVWLNRGLSIGVRALYHGISFTDNIGTDKPFLSTVSLEGNLQFHF